MIKKITVNFPGGKKVNTSIGDYIIKTDQPIDSGGEGSSPNPFQLFLSSIAACIGYFALQFCQFRKIPTDGMKLEVECSLNQEEKRYDKITVNLKLPDSFPEKYNNAIIEAMNSCTVKKHLYNPPEFEINAI